MCCFPPLDTAEVPLRGLNARRRRIGPSSTGKSRFLRQNTGKGIRIALLAISGKQLTFSCQPRGRRRVLWDKKGGSLPN